MNRIVFAPKGVSAEHMKTLQDAFAALQKDKTYQRLMKRIGENTEMMMGADYEKVRAEQNAEYKKLVESITK
jgi:tripartite-type tricarboxylate transporter receptor subunit TctC